MSYAPRYREIEQVLRSRIAGLRPGQRLPSDADLCMEFGVSRMTARHAMTQLADEGLVRRDPGRGTFVAEPPTHRRATFLMTFSREMRRRGQIPTSRIVRLERRAPTGPELQELRLQAGAHIVELRRVRLADGVALAIETAVLTPDCAPLLDDADVEHGSLHDILNAAGIVPTRSASTITAVAADQDDALLLGVPVGQPLLVERRLIMDQHGRPLERTESRYAAERYGLDVAFSIDDGGAAIPAMPVREGLR